MKAAEWIFLISNEKDKKFARAACMEVLAEASVRELVDALKQHKPDCTTCFNDSTLRQPDDAVCQQCIFDSDELRNNYLEVKP